MNNRRDFQFNFYHEDCPDILDALSSPAKMRFAERLMIYSLVIGTRPSRVLEIGTDRGGTAKIIVEALRYIGCGKLVCVDPSPIWDADLNLSACATLIVGRSPEALEACFQTAGGLFDMVLIDGDHEYESVAADLAGVLPYMADDGRIVLHDYLYPPTARAIRDGLNENEALVNCGALTAQSIDYQGLTQGGLYLLRVRKDVPHG